MAPRLESNVFKTALFFEGGSMRACYSSAVAVHLLEQGIYFDNVYGISAGSSNTVNYLSRDIERTRASFTSFIGDPHVGSMKTFLQGRGAFNAEYIYQEAGLPDGKLPFDWETFQNNPAKCCVISFDRDTGEDLYFTRETMRTLDDLMMQVRASSTLPVIMPMPTVEGRPCYDGGFARGGGIPLQKIEEDGFEKVVVIRTQRRGYRKKKYLGWANAWFWHRPVIREAMTSRWIRYNESCDLLDQWEREGRAYVFYCDDLTVAGQERDVELLQANYDAGYAQIQRDFPALMRFIEDAER